MSNDVGRYRIVFARIWRHPGFRALSPSSRLVALYLLTGPQVNRIGVYHLSAATAAEDLKLGADTFRKGLADVAATFGWLFDADASVFYIPSWWRWNRPQNPNHLQGNLKDLNEVPASALVEAFARTFDTLPETYHRTFLEGVTQRLGERPPNLNLDREWKQKREREPRAARGNEKQSSPPIDKILTTIAKETLTLVSPNRPIEELIDAFHQVARSKSMGNIERVEAERALAIVLSERRQALA